MVISHELNALRWSLMKLIVILCAVYNLYALLNVTTKVNNDEEGKTINSINTRQLILSWQSKTKP